MGDFKLRWVILARARANGRSLRPYISTSFSVLMGHFKINGRFQQNRWVILTQQWGVLNRPMGDFNPPMCNFSVPNGAQQTFGRRHGAILMAQRAILGLMDDFSWPNGRFLAPQWALLRQVALRIGVDPVPHEGIHGNGLCTSHHCGVKSVCLNRMRRRNENLLITR